MPYYRDLFRKLDIHPEAVRTPEDMKMFPYLTKDQIRQAGNNLISDQYNPAKLCKGPNKRAVQACQ